MSPHTSESQLFNPLSQLHSGEFHDFMPNKSRGEQPNTQSKGPMIGQLGLRGAAMYRDYFSPRPEQMVRRESPENGKEPPTPSDQGYTPPMSPPLFDPEELRKYSDMSLSSEDWATLREWEQAQSRIPESPRMLESSCCYERTNSSSGFERRRPSTIVTVETETWTRQYDPEDSDDFEEGISPKDTRRFSQDVQEDHEQSSNLDRRTSRQGSFDNGIRSSPQSSSANPFQLGNTKKFTPLPSRASLKNHSRHDTHLSGMPDYGIHHPNPKRNRGSASSFLTGHLSQDSTSTLSIDKFRLDSEPGRCGVLPSLPESLIEQEQRQNFEYQMRGETYSFWGDPLTESIDIERNDYLTTYNVMRQARVDAVIQEEQEAIEAQAEMERLEAERMELEARRRRRERLLRPITGWNLAIFCWCSANLGIIAFWTSCFAHGSVHREPEGIVFGTIAAIFWLVCMWGTYLWWQHEGRLLWQQRIASQDGERRPLLGDRTVVKHRRDSTSV